MAIAEKHIDEFVQLYDGGKGDSIADIHAAYPAFTKAAITYHLKQRGAYVGVEKKPVDNRSSDDDLGIGEEDTSVSNLNALLADPALAALIDQAVAARVAQMGISQSAAPPSDQMTAFTATLKHMIDMQQMQQPGYIKPLPADEIDRRAAGRVEMFALLETYERNRTPPLWTVGEQGFIECTNMLEFGEGEQIRTYLPPVEDFIPENEEAMCVHEAMMQWIGGPTPEIGEQLKQAQLDAKAPPLVGSTLNIVAKPSLVEKVQSSTPVAKTASQKRRTMGTIVAERREVVAGDRGVTGPAFTDAA